MCWRDSNQATERKTTIVIVSFVIFIAVVSGSQVLSYEY